MEKKIEDIVTRSVNARGEIHYTLEEQLYLIGEYIFEKKGVRPDLTLGNGMMEVMLLNTAFDVSLRHFMEKTKNVSL